jgi:hypothetical protein
MIKLQSTIIYNPGTLVRIKSTNKYGIIISIHEKGFISNTYNILPLNTSKWKVVKWIQVYIIKKLIND